MSHQHEYSNAMTKGSACSYASLCAYNQGGAMAPVPHKTVVGKYIVPSYSAPGYDALTHGSGGTCGGHFNIQQAYGAGAGRCNQSYTTSLCGSCTKHHQ